MKKANKQKAMAAPRAAPEQPPEVPNPTPSATDQHSIAECLPNTGSLNHATIDSTPCASLHPTSEPTIANLLSPESQDEPSLQSSTVSDYHPEVSEDKLVEALQHHLVVDENIESNIHNTDAVVAPETVAPIPYHLPGAHITSDIYKMSNELAQKPRTRSKSTTDMQDAVEQERQTDDPVLENVSRPGGFRRYFVDQQQRQNELDDSETSAILGNSLPRYGATASPSPMPMKRTRHFLEFVAVNQYRNLYDSFAGEYLADEDEETTDEESTIGRLIERMPPLSRKHSFVAEKDRASTTKAFFLLLKAVSDQFLQWVNLYIVPRCTNSFVIVCLTVHRIWHSLFAQSVSHEN